MIRLPFLLNGTPYGGPGGRSRDHRELGRAGAPDANIYYTSVGRNCPLLLDVPPDKTGQLHPDDVSRLAEFGNWVHGAFGSPVTGTATPVADSTRRTWQVTLAKPAITTLDGYLDPAQPR
jgi:hypothetical protein